MMQMFISKTTAPPPPGPPHLLNTSSLKTAEKEFSEGGDSASWAGVLVTGSPKPGLSPPFIVMLLGVHLPARDPGGAA